MRPGEGGEKVERVEDSHMTDLHNETSRVTIKGDRMRNRGSWVWCKVRKVMITVKLSTFWRRIWWKSWGGISDYSPHFLKFINWETVNTEILCNAVEVSTITKHKRPSEIASGVGLRIERFGVGDFCFHYKFFDLSSLFPLIHVCVSQYR